MGIIVGDDDNLKKIFEKNNNLIASNKVYYDKNSKVVQNNESITVPKASYTFAKFKASKCVVDIRPNITYTKDGKIIQNGYKFLDIREWHDSLPGKEKWSLANLTLYEPSGTASGPFVRKGSVKTPATYVPYYTMESEKFAGRFFNDYITVAVMKDNTVKLYETDSKLSSERKIIRDLPFIQYAFSGTDILIRNGGETNKNAIGKLNKNKARAKTSIGISGKDTLIVAVTVPNSGDDTQNWEMWGNTLRSIDSTATWISMDGGGSPGIIINGVIKQVAEKRQNQPNGRRIATIIAWYEG